jgi:DNA-binding CsgD family transcriptional regulator
MNWVEYNRLVRQAQAWFTRRRVSSLDGREPEDYALEAMRAPEQTQARRLYFDLIDGQRREYGRVKDGRRSMRRWHDPLPLRGIPVTHDRTDRDWIALWPLKTEREREVALLLAAGATKPETAMRLGISLARVCQLCDRIAIRVMEQGSDVFSGDRDRRVRLEGHRLKKPSALRREPRPRRRADGRGDSVKAPEG